MALQIELTRFAYTPMGTFGKLYFPEFECFTVEKPWNDNKRRVSCIPEGEYEIKLGRFNRGGYDAYELQNVPNRSLVKIHVGNTSDDVIGCIALGKSLGYVKQKWAVISSRTTYKEFMAAMEDVNTANLVISRQQLDNM